MPYGNSLVISGNLTADPDLRFSAGGTAYTRFTVAHSHGKDKDASFFDCTAFGDLAENLAESLEKGMRVIVEGRVKQDRWETDEGDKRSKISVQVDDVGPSLRWATATVHREEWTGPADDDEELF